MKRILLSYFASLLLSPVLLGSGQASYSFYPVSIERGLSQPNVLSILSDRKGILWIGTANGLNRFCNQSIRIYDCAGDAAGSLPDSRIEALAEDREGSLWVMTRGGVSRYDPGMDGFETVSPEPAGCALVLDDRILFGGDGYLFQKVYGKDAIEKLCIFDRTDLGHKIISMVQVDDGRVLIGTLDSGIFTLDLRNMAAVPFTKVVRPQLVTMYVSRDGMVNASFFADGFYRYSPDGTEVSHYTRSNSGLSSDYVQAFLEYEDRLWIATDGGGISLYSKEDDSFSVISHEFRGPFSLPSNSITVLYEDGFGTLWAGSVKKGFFQIRHNFIRTLSGPPSGLADDAVSSLYKDRDGTLWVGTDGGGLHHMSPGGERCIPCPSTEGDKILSIAGFGEDKLILSIYTKGIFTFDKRTGDLRPFTLIDEETHRKMCFCGYLPRIGQVSDDKLYILGNKALIYDIRSGRFSPMPKEQEGTPSDGLRIAFSDERLSLFCRGNLVLLADRKDDMLRTLFSTGEDGMVTSLAFDGDGTIWVGTERGFGRYDLRTGVYEKESTSLFSNVTALDLDRKGRLWICADNHLFTYLPEGRIVSWSASDGFRPNDVKMLFLNRQDDDYIFFGGSGGLARIDRDIQIPSMNEPTVFLDALSLDGCPLSRVKEGGDLKIRWSYKSISASFHVRCRDMFRRVMFRYIIEGEHGTSTLDSYEPQLVLPALPPGRYRIKVSCLSKNGTMVEPKEIVRLIITPPFYKTGIFIGGVSLLACLTAVYFTLKMRKKHEKASKTSMARFLEGILSQSCKDSGDQLQEEERPIKRSPFLERFEGIVNSNLSNPDLGVKLLCSEMPMSRSSLYSRVKEETGMGVNDYINRLRIEKSVDLLLNTDLTISEISYEVGFSYPRYFSTSFKNMKGMTPTHFKLANKAARDTDRKDPGK